MKDSSAEAEVPDHVPPPPMIANEVKTEPVASSPASPEPAAVDPLGKIVDYLKTFFSVRLGCDNRGRIMTDLIEATKVNSILCLQYLP